MNTALGCEWAEIVLNNIVCVAVTKPLCGPWGVLATFYNEPM